ncbi:hypothetical protein [Dyella nitratireducens]|uniref:Uncharacterized protein n=1 Tax=Dyella nitratireducens TaxID=1849580 RepID=A0ABQ1FKE5_9GAMM|nr:hypothetical protein [Dyella nitratireducens]GGA16417.1 hypothetical protein GCM10010981_00050 [Dyella nitratireducens]GLQ44935.1 hypothetical protein GCM10007902_47850 [Dyella nitratireducens]
MSTTYRWYRVGLPKKGVGIVKLLSKYPLLAESEFGFTPLEDDGQIQKLRFLWRTKVVVTRISDEGVPFNEEFASVNFLDFAIIFRDVRSYFRLENPGHGGKHLFNAIETISGLDFTCEPMKFQFSNPAEIFGGVESAKLTGLSVSGAVVTQDLVARLEFASKQGMDVEKIRWLKGVEYRIDSSAFEVTYRGLKGHVTLSSGGTMKVSGALSPRLVTQVEKYLTGTKRRS